MDNTKLFWEAHKPTYDAAVAAPMKALTTALADEFGDPKIFRPYRDVRFAKDKTPYKTHQGAFVPKGPSTGYYVQVGAPGVRVGVGYYDASPARLASIRDAIVEKRRGGELEEILATMQAHGWELGGDRLKTAPRGYDVDHPRIALLRHKSMNLSKDYGFEPIIHTPELLDRVRADWRDAGPFVDWVLRHAKG
ncbi:TIGR02453 family protein [Aeromicrobium sp. A1-2]|nr:TIGR02453 family protein [Aeromicrobium sp. A1-2]